MRRNLQRQTQIEKVFIFWFIKGILNLPKFVNLNHKSLYLGSKQSPIFLNQNSMKKLAKILLIYCLSITYASLSYAQEDPSPYNGQPKPERIKRNILKVNLISPVLRSFSMAYENVLNKNTSFQVTMFFIGDNDTDLRNGFGITPEVRLYLSDRKNAPAGFFVAPFLTYQNYKLDYSVFDNSRSTWIRKEQPSSVFGAGVIIGGQWVFKNRVSLDVWGGPGYSFLNAPGIDTNNYYGFPYTSGPMGRFGCTLGFLF
jgi:hypothetical protein